MRANFSGAELGRTLAEQNNMNCCLPPLQGVEDMLYIRETKVVKVHQAKGQVRQSVGMKVLQVHRQNKEQQRRRV